MSYIYFFIGSIFLRCLSDRPSYLDEPPSISEGWGGRITDYRISVSHHFICNETSFHCDVRTLVY